MQNGKLLSFLPAQIAHQMHIKNRLLLYASLCIVADCYAMNVCWSLHLWDLARRRERQERAHKQYSLLETMMHHETLRKKLIQGLQTETIIENPAYCGFGTCGDFAGYLGYVCPADQKIKNKIARHNRKMYEKRTEEFLQKFFAGYDTH